MKRVLRLATLRKLFLFVSTPPDISDDMDFSKSLLLWYYHTINIVKVARLGKISEITIV